MPFHKITNTSPIIGTVTRVGSVPGKFGENRQVDLDTPLDGPYTIEEGSKGFDRELGKLRLTFEQLVGKTVEFSKTPMPDDPTKGYLNIRILTKGAPLNAPQSVPPVPPTVQAPLAPMALGSLGDFDRIVGPDPRAAVAVGLGGAVAAGLAPAPATNGVSSNGNVGREAWSQLHADAFKLVLAFYLPALQQAGGDVAGAVSALTFQLAKGWSERGAGR